MFRRSQRSHRNIRRFVVGQKRERNLPGTLACHQSLDMEAFRASEDVLLNNYEWVDRKHGVVRIPINRAMEMLVQRGTPP